MDVVGSIKASSSEESRVNGRIPLRMMMRIKKKKTPNVRFTRLPELSLCVSNISL